MFFKITHGTNFTLHLIFDVFIEKEFYLINFFLLNRDAEMNSPRCDICNIDFHRAFYAKHLGSKKKHLQNEK